MFVLLCERFGGEVTCFHTVDAAPYMVIHTFKRSASVDGSAPVGRGGQSRAPRVDGGGPHEHLCRVAGRARWSPGWQMHGPGAPGWSPCCWSRHGRAGRWL